MPATSACSAGRCSTCFPITSTRFRGQPGPAPRERRPQGCPRRTNTAQQTATTTPETSRRGRKRPEVAERLRAGSRGAGRAHGRDSSSSIRRSARKSGIQWSTAYWSTPDSAPAVTSAGQHAESDGGRTDRRDRPRPLRSLRPGSLSARPAAGLLLERLALVVSSRSPEEHEADHDRDDHRDDGRAEDDHVHCGVPLDECRAPPRPPS